MIETSGKRILIVDDAALVRAYYRSPLEVDGFEVDEALNGLEGLEKVLLQPFDLVIVDINMPQMDGITFLQALRSKNLPISAVPVLVMSTESGISRYYGRSEGRRELLSGEADKPKRSYRVRCYLLRDTAMNEFLQQFLVESRELIVQATDDLLALEERPGERDRLDDAFRAFHTLKGAAAIVEFSAMSRTFHAAEDVLAAVRSSEGAITVSIVDGCLACLDLTSRWLDAIQTNGETPAVAETEADAMISRLVASQDTEQREEAEDPGAETWLGKIPDIASEKRDAALTAVRFIPHPDAFFEGHDPIAIVAGLPELLG